MLRWNTKKFRKNLVYDQKEKKNHPFIVQRRKIKHEEEKKNPEINYATWNENREKSVHPFPPPRIPSPATFAIILSSALAHSSRLLKLSHLELYNTSCFHGLITCYFIVTPFPFIRLFLRLICGTTKFMTTLISVYCIIVILFHYLFMACLERLKSKIMTTDFK